jgi:hypothetical protein
LSIRAEIDQPRASFVVFLAVIRLQAIDDVEETLGARSAAAKIAPLHVGELGLEEHAGRAEQYVERIQQVVAQPPEARVVDRARLVREGHGVCSQATDCGVRRRTTTVRSSGRGLVIVARSTSRSATDVALSSGRICAASV